MYVRCHVICLSAAQDCLITVVCGCEGNIIVFLSILGINMCVVYFTNVLNIKTKQQLAASQFAYCPS